MHAPLHIIHRLDQALRLLNIISSSLLDHLEV